MQDFASFTSGFAQRYSQRFVAFLLNWEELVKHSIEFCLLSPYLDWDFSLPPFSSFVDWTGLDMEILLTERRLYKD